MFELASVTSALVNVATTIIDDLGYTGIFLLLVAASAAVPVSSEAVMLFAGFDVYKGHFALLAIIIVAVAGDLIGASIAYAIGYFGRRELLAHHGRSSASHPSGSPRPSAGSRVMETRLS